MFPAFVGAVTGTGSREQYLVTRSLASDSHMPPHSITLSEAVIYLSHSSYIINASTIHPFLHPQGTLAYSRAPEQHRGNE